MMNEFEQTLNKVNNMQKTENGALGYSTTGKNLVDLNFTVPSNHNNVSGENIQKFLDALHEDMVSAVKWMFYLRDVREGLGERDSFVNLFIALHSYDQDAAIKVLPLIPEYGRWKDVIDIFSRCADDLPITDKIYEMVHNQLMQDCEDMTAGKGISLLAKWMPSINATPKARKNAMRFCHKFGLIYKEYRGLLSALRQYLDVTEVKTCGGAWDQVDYNRVSSNANSRYVKAFMKHDPERRKEYLSSLAKPESGAVMHASNLYPYEVFSKYDIYGRPREFSEYRHDPLAVADPGIEALWDNLKSIPTTGNTMVVCDGSGSMESHIQGSSVMAIDVARSLGVFFAEKCEGEFHNRLIEFSANPQFIDLTGCETLADKYNEMCRHTDCSNTNLEKVFDLLLMTALDHKIPQEELPQRILIVSDMEFDSACEYKGVWDGSDHIVIMARYRTLFETIRQKWTAAGYVMPEIVFWNVNSRTNTIPVQANEVGVNLVAGFSVNNVKMILAGKVDPWNALKSVLDSERYAPVEEALK
jgi:hypothetical protein